MKINSIHIFGFGKFKDYNLDFRSDFNLIYGQNENGKTTIAEFIKMMFYGSHQRVSDVFKNPRVKYRPLDGSTMAGSITFNHCGTNYRLEREFRTSNATDKITLHNLDLGASETLSGKTEIGTRFFGIGFGAFEKSVFISNSVIFESNSEADDDINSKLSNITKTGDENVSFEAVASRITAAMEEIKTKTGRGGSIVKLDSTITALQEQAANAKLKSDERDALEKDIDTLTAHLEQLSQEKKALFEKLKSAEKNEIKTKLQEFISIAEKFESIEKSITLLNGQVADKEYCDKLDLLIINAEKLADLCVTLSADAEKLTAEICTLQDAIDEQNESEYREEHKKASEEINELLKEKDALHIEKIRCEGSVAAAKPKINTPLLIIGIILCVIAFLGGLFIDRFLFVFSGIGVILFLLAFISKTKSDTKAVEMAIKELTERTENIERLIFEKQTSLQGLNEKIQLFAVKKATNESVLSEKKSALIEKRTLLLEKQNEEMTAKSEVINFAAQLFGANDIKSAKELSAKIKSDIEELGRLQVAAEYAVKGTGCKNLDEAKSRLSTINTNTTEFNESLTEIKAQLDSVSEKYNALSNNLASLKAEARSTFAGLKVPAEYEREKAELLKLRDEQNEYFEVLSLAQTGLAEAFGEVRRSFSGPLEERALKLLAEITDYKYGSINVSKNFDISVADKDNFGTHGLEYLSKGAMHQAYFSLRLALAELMSEETSSLPIILDDAFSQYDDMRLKTAMKFLKKYSENSQVIFFTCHNDCKEVAKEENANIINL